jgi:choline dehydrogenase
MSRQNDGFLPRYADVVIVGGGTSGAVLAGRLAEQFSGTVLLLEAGPDYGPFASGAWPAPLLDARAIPWNLHDWGYTSAARHGLSGLTLERARVLGGCSAHNGCAAIWGHRADYDGWAQAGNPGWSTQDLLPLFRAAHRRLRVRQPPPEEITPWHQAVLAAAPRAGLPLVDDLNDLEQDTGIAASPANIAGGVRWNAAFAYLDPVRGAAHLTIADNVLVDRLVVRQGRVVGLEAIGPGGSARIEAGLVVLCAGAYGSPALLLRSGIGPPDDLRALGIAPQHALAGVGQNLHDHPALLLSYTGTPRLIAAMEAFAAAGGWLCEEQTIAKARSSLCAAAFDLHLYPVGSPYWGERGAWLFMLPVANMTPLSRGSLALASHRPDVAPLIDHGYLTDPDDRDLAVLLEGIALARALAAREPLAGLIGQETAPGALLRDGEELRAYVRQNCVHYYHPVGTCKMGPPGDPLAVVDHHGRVHGLDGVVVADASLMPVIPRANTNLPCAVIGEKIAASLLHTLGAGGAPPARG